jgi:toxin ParE1/3/4
VAEVVWTARASADLEAIGDYLAQSAPGYAEVVVRRVLAAVGRLEAFPASGRVVPEIGEEELREVVLRSYRVVYFYDEEGDRVEVLTVFHASQQFGGLSGEG